MGVVKLNNEALVKGSSLASTDKLTFTQGAKLLVSSQQYGKLVIQQNPQTVLSERQYTLQELLAKSKRASSKGNTSLGNELDFKNYFGASQFTIIGTNMEVKVGELKFKLTPQTFFYLTFRHSSSNEPLNKQIQAKGQTLLFDKNMIFTVDGTALSDSDKGYLCQLYYYNVTSEKSWLMAEFTLQFMDEELLREPAKSIIEMVNWQQQPSPENYDTIVKSLAVVMPDTTNKTNLEEWLEKSFNVSKPIE